MRSLTTNIDDLLEDAETAKPVQLKHFVECSLKVVKLEGDYPFHSHENSDETFVILEGELQMERDGLPTIHMKSGDIVTIPQGLRHRTRTKTPTKVLLLGPK